MIGGQGGLWEPSRFQFSRAEMIELMGRLQCVFDIVRLVEPITGMQWMLDGEGGLREADSRCWTVWNRDVRCEYCISRRVMKIRDRIAKFEFVDDDLFHILAKYVVVDGHEYSLEMVSRVPDETMMEGRGRRDIVEAIARHNKRVYADPLTGAYNRRYLEEAFQGVVCDRAIAMLDTDDFKLVNDTYGHNVGDQVLKGLVEAVTSCVRSADAVIRFGGDEFTVIFEGMPLGKLPDKLEQIRRRVQRMIFEEHPELHVTVSIGGAYGSGEITELIERADRMLYHAKTDGKNRVRVESA